MTKTVRQGQYKVGRVKDGSRNQGTYGVIRGRVANDNSHEEWKGFIGLKESSWFAYRIFDSGSMSSICVTTHLLKEFDTKSDAVKWLKSRYNFDKEF